MGLFSKHQEAELFGSAYYTYVKPIKQLTGGRLKDLSKKEVIALFFLSEENYRNAVIKNDGEVEKLSIKNLSDPRDLWRWLTVGLRRYINGTYNNIEIEEHWEKMKNNSLIIEWTLNGSVWYENLSVVTRNYKAIEPSDFR
jgi:hypothetical protein